MEAGEAQLALEGLLRILHYYNYTDKRKFWYRAVYCRGEILVIKLLHLGFYFLILRELDNEWGKLLKALLKRKHLGDIPTLWPLGLCYLFNSLHSCSLAYLWIWLTHSPAAQLDKIRQKMLIENPPSFPTESDFRIHWLAKPNLFPALCVLYGLITAKDNLPAGCLKRAHNGQTPAGSPWLPSGLQRGDLRGPGWEGVLALGRPVSKGPAVESCSSWDPAA